MRELVIGGLLAVAAAALWPVEESQAQPENAAKYGWLTSLAKGKEVAQQSGKPLFVVFRCEP
jgi:hypothetical protein